MKRIFIIMGLSMVLSSCSTFKTAMIGDDLYSAHNRTEIAMRQKAEAEAARAEAEARQAAWEAKLAEARAIAAENEFKEVSTIPASINPYDAVLADDYQSAYARRLYGFSSPSYRMPSSYYTYRYTDAYHYASAYDPAFYNVMISGDQVWVEPKYITSMFGSWGATVVVPTYSWYYGWSRPHYSWWYGYPRYSWYDWGWGVGYDPYWGWNFGWGWGGYPYYPGFVPPYHHHHHHYPHYGGGHRPHRPTVAHRPNSSGPGGRPSYISGGGGYRPSTPSYNSGGGSGRGQYRGGTVTGSGEYRGRGGSSGSNTQYRGTGSRTSNSYNKRNDNNSFRNNSSSSSFGGYSGGYSGGGNFSGGSHGGGQGRR